MAKSYKLVKVATELDACVQDAYQLAQELRDEVREVADNLESGNLGQTQRAQGMSSAADELDGFCDNIAEVPETLHELRIEFLEETPTRKGRQPSRSVRASNVAAMLEAVKEKLGDYLSDVEESIDQLDKEKPSADRSADQILADHDAAEKMKDDLEEAVNKLDEDIATLQGVEFPGMYG